MLKPEYTNKFQKDLQLCQKRGYKTDKLKTIMKKLIEEDIPLPIHNRDHNLSGDMAGYRECHIEPDWLLVYYYMEGIIVFARTGTHSDLFR